LTIVKAYSSGNYEGFLKFRKPEDVDLKPLDSEWNSITAAWFRAHPDAPAKDLPDDEALYRWWIEQDSFYQGYWQGIMISSEMPIGFWESHVIPAVRNPRWVFIKEIPNLNTIYRKN